MKFLAGFITATLIALIVVISAWLYFDLPIDTNNETETYNPPQEVQQQSYNDHIEEQETTSTRQDYNLPDKQVLDYTSTEPTNLSEQGKQDLQHILQVAKHNNEQGTLNDFDRKVISNIQNQNQIGIEELK